jgi:ribonuclease BN (tRNA processing enzyme)
MRTEATWPGVDAIAISHFHLDHWGDIVPWVWGSTFGPGAQLARPQLLLPPGGREYLAGLAPQLGGDRDLFERAFDVGEYADREAVELAGFELTPVRVEHYGTDAYGFRVSDGRRTLAYSADSAPGDALVELARDADLFVCEATLATGEPEPRGHLSLAEAEAAFTAAGARRLLVTHRPQELAVSDGVELARDGLVLEL